MTFITEQWVKLVDIEEFGKQCKEVPPALQYRIKVDKSYHVINTPFFLFSALEPPGSKFHIKSA